jgi:pyruvate dehydrogenase E2 component (dihydrolipoamide acetyltransferase)
MPALGMAQETGTLMRWLKAPGEAVAKGEPLMEVETDKATVEVEAPASGILAGVTAHPGDTIPVGQRIALLLAPGEAAPTDNVAATPSSRPSSPAAPVPTPVPAPKVAPISASPTAARIAAEHQLDVAQIRPQGGRVQKDDVLAYLAARQSPADRRTLASPKARRLAQERGLELRAIRGSGPDGAVLAADVLKLSDQRAVPASDEAGRWSLVVGLSSDDAQASTSTSSTIWRVMAQRVSQAWTTIPHFYLLREVNTTHLIAWRDEAQERYAAQPDAAHGAGKITYTDLLVKVVAAALRRHPRLNASWQNDALILHPEINIGLAVAVEDGLVVPVLHRADTLGLGQLAARRAQLVAKANAGRLAPADLSGGTFTISNLGMYGVDAFNAIVNPPQVAILAVSRIAERVVPLHGQPAVQPMLTLSLSCDHRAVDGARGAQFLQTVAELIEHPMRLLD